MPDDDRLRLLADVSKERRELRSERYSEAELTAIAAGLASMGLRFVSSSSPLVGDDRYARAAAPSPKNPSDGCGLYCVFERAFASRSSRSRIQHRRRSLSSLLSSLSSSASLEPFRTCPRSVLEPPVPNSRPTSHRDAGSAAASALWQRNAACLAQTHLSR